MSVTDPVTKTELAVAETIGDEIAGDWLVDVVDLEDIEREDWNGWEWYPTPKIPGIVAQWVDDVDDPAVAVVISPSYDSKPQEGAAGRTITGSRRRRRGYTVKFGPTDGDGSTNTTVATRWGAWGATPKETAQEVLDELPPIALAFMLAHPPEDIQTA